MISCLNFFISHIFIRWLPFCLFLLVLYFVIIADFSSPVRRPSPLGFRALKGTCPPKRPAAAAS
jgi:hypothetical protein